MWTKGNKAKKLILELLEFAEIQEGGPNPWDITIHDERTYAKILNDPELGAGESYMDGWWDCPHLDQFVERIKRAQLENKFSFNFKFYTQFLLQKLINFQTRKRSQKVAKIHYDIGNDLYACMLDKNMNYSCAYWKYSDDLDTAQEHKLELICRKLQLKPGMTLLDIGCGWGSMAIHAAKYHGVKVEGITIQSVNASLSTYHFDQAAINAYDFYWKEFCSYYVEIVKPVLFGKMGSAEERKNKQKLLTIILLQIVRLIHPMAPFITEELFQKLKERFQGVVLREDADPYTQEAIKALQAPACIVAPYPQVIREQDINLEINRSFDLVGKVVYTIRNIRGEMKIPPGQATDVLIIGQKESKNYPVIEENQGIIHALIKTDSIEMHTEETHQGFASTGMVEDLKLVIPMPHNLIEKEYARLKKEEERLLKQLEKVQAQLNNKEFIAKAPKPLIEKQQALLQQTEKELKEVVEKQKAQKG